MRRQSKIAIRPGGSVPALACLLFLGIAGVGAQGTPTISTFQLDADCIRFDNPTAVVNGEIVYVSFTAYDWAVEHAVAAWSPERGFTIPMRRALPIDDAVPAEATLIYRDASVPDSAFKGATVTWSNAPATISLNLAHLPEPNTTDTQERDEILAVMTHETGHALGLGDVPPPGVTIRECANMLMKRSVDKGGGPFTLPQAGDIALYCMRWGGSVCQGIRSLATPALPTSTSRSAAWPDPMIPMVGNDAVRYRFFVVTCEGLPTVAITPEQVGGDALTIDRSLGCVRAPAGMLFQLNRDDDVQSTVLTNGEGELSVELPSGVDAELTLPEGAWGGFPSLVGYEPLEQGRHLSADDPACTFGPDGVCEAVYILIPQAGRIAERQVSM